MSLKICLAFLSFILEGNSFSRALTKGLCRWGIIISVAIRSGIHGEGSLLVDGSLVTPWGAHLLALHRSPVTSLMTLLSRAHQ